MHSGEKPVLEQSRHEDLNRLNVKERATVVMTSQASLVAEEGEAAFWSPLARLEAREWVPFGRAGRPIFIAPLTGNEILSLEEKETRADFAAQLRTIDDRVAGFFVPISGAIPNAVEVDPGDSQQIEDIVLSAARVRDFGTMAIRLAGLDDFWDPEWAVGLFEMRQKDRRKLSVCIH